MKVINGHKIITPAECKCTEDTEDCPTCDWGLNICSVCGKAEGDLDEPCKRGVPQQ